MKNSPMVRGMLPAALVGVAALSVAWASPREAGPRQVTHRWVEQFGMVTPADGQILRLHAVHLVHLQRPPDPRVAAEPPPDPDLPPGPCRVLLAFQDSEGALIGAPVSKSLDVGKSGFVDLSFGPGTNDIPPGPCRASVWVFQPGSPGTPPPYPCQATLELLDGATGRVSVHMLPAVQHALPAVQ